MFSMILTKMKIAICSIQRDRGPWIKEWVAFHHLMGVGKFYIYLHRCTDESSMVIAELSEHFDITAFSLSDDVFRPQLSAYQHCYSTFGQQHDWIAFVDGDEFLFPTVQQNLELSLLEFEDKPIDAIGVYWACFGSSGYFDEPSGLIIDNYRRRAPLDFGANSHFKSIVKGGLGTEFSVLQNSHYFQTKRGTFDTSMRPLSHGHMNHEPHYDVMRINHYVTQSRSFFLNYKKHSGAPDIGSNATRSEDWWNAHDRNDVLDDSLIHIAPSVRDLLRKIS